MRYRLRVPSRALYAACSAVVFATVLCPEAASVSSGDLLVLPSVESSIHAYAFHVAQTQSASGEFGFKDAVQGQLKAGISLAIAGEAVGEPYYLDAARRSLAFIESEHLEDHGGVNWNGTDSEYFFECHQHWMLILSRLVARPEDEDRRRTETRVWRFLTGGNPSTVDLYRYKETECGAFFAFRDVRRNGQVQTQAPWKGAYEVGSALWSMALHRDTPWLQEMGAYRETLVQQTAQSTDEKGFFDVQRGMWGRALVWQEQAWDGWEEPDWKYAADLEVCTLRYLTYLDNDLLRSRARSHLEAVLSMVERDGSVAGIGGGAVYEQGLLLSMLALGSTVFDDDRELALRCLEAARRVYDRVVTRLTPGASEGHCILDANEK